jgi:hypothetical protein
VHAHGIVIPQFVADVEVDAFAHDQLPVAVDVDRLPGLALHRPWRIHQSRHGDFCRGRELQAEMIGLADLGWKITAALMHRKRQRFVGEMDHELAAALDVDQVSFSRPSGRRLTASMQSGGSSQNMLKKLNGAALTTPVGPRLVTQAIGSGSTNEVSTL